MRHVRYSSRPLEHSLVLKLLFFILKFLVISNKSRSQSCIQETYPVATPLTLNDVGFVYEVTVTRFLQGIWDMFCFITGSTTVTVKLTWMQKLRQSQHNPPCQFPIHCQWSSSRIYLLMKSKIRGLFLWVLALIESCSCQKMLNELSNVVRVFFTLLDPARTFD